MWRLDLSGCTWPLAPGSESPEGVPGPGLRHQRPLRHCHQLAEAVGRRLSIFPGCGVASVKISVKGPQLVGARDSTYETGRKQAGKCKQVPSAKTLVSIVDDRKRGFLSTLHHGL